MPPVSIYFDYNATTPLDSAVRAAMAPYLGDIFGNPSSIHHVGRRARAMLDEARDRLAALWRAKPSEVVFTSGGTESNNLAILGAARQQRKRGRHIITTTIEHDAVLHPCRYLTEHDGFEVTYLPVTPEGFVTVDSLAKALRPDTVLVSVMAANNETGAIQPVVELGKLCRERGVLFHTDAVQWFGKLPFESMQQFSADLVSVCAHKFHGPKGAGALYIRSPLQPDPILFGGGHENERRAGTENLPAIAGFVEAFARFVPAPVFPADRLTSWIQRLRSCAAGLSGHGVIVRSPSVSCLANTLAFTVRGSDSLTLLAGLDLEGICASAGAACSAGSLEPSHVLLAMGVSAAESNALVRFSLGRETTEAEVAHVCEVLPGIVEQARR